MQDGSDNVRVDHNTALDTNAVLYATASTGSPHSGDRNSGFVFQNNIVHNGTLGIVGDGEGSGHAALARYFTSPVVRNNAFIAGVPALYPENNFFPGTTGDVGFVDLSRADYRLSSTSAYRAAATDGTDLGYSKSLPGAPPSPPASSPAPTPTGTATATVTRTEDNAGVVFTDSWHANAGIFHSGSHAMLSMEPTARASVTFNGTAVTVVTYNDQWSGIAAVYIDGDFKSEIDTYAPSSKAQYKSYSISGLPSGQHTISIAPTGRKNADSGGTWIWVDAFDVTTTSSSEMMTEAGPMAPWTTRVEQDGNGISYSGAWSPNTLAVLSGSSAVLAVDAGARATFAFNGTGASWIAYRDAWSGIARIYVDGALAGSIDTYSSADTPQTVMYTVSGLPSGSHTLVIEVTGTKSGASGGAWVWIDAFDVSR
jgi:hypothetical protein